MAPTLPGHTLVDEAAFAPVMLVSAVNNVSAPSYPIQFVDEVMATLPFKVERVQTDNGSEFGQSFHWHLLDLGVDHVKIKPRTPRLNGKVERSHRIDSEEFYRLLEGQVIDDTNLFAEKLQEWEDYYNYHRPHGALNGQTPYERLRQKTQDPLS